jgi:hypothetical protein
MESMQTVRVVEFIAGWLAVVTRAAIALYIWQGGFIEPDAVVVDLTTFGLILGVIALSVTLESLTGSLVARFTLALGAIALSGVFVVSFVIELGIPALLAVAATLIAFTRHLPAPAPRRLDAR